jgi:hypothetical protein
MAHGLIDIHGTPRLTILISGCERKSSQKGKTIFAQSRKAAKKVKEQGPLNHLVFPLRLGAFARDGFSSFPLFCVPACPGLEHNAEIE